MSRKTTSADAEEVLRLRAQGEMHGAIVKKTGLTKNVVSRILGGWRPSAKGRTIPKLAKPTSDSRAWFIDRRRA